MNLNPEVLADSEKLNRQQHRTIYHYLFDGDPGTHHYLSYIAKTFKRADRMLLWLVKNKLRGKKLIEFFQNESVDGGGYLCGCATIISRMDGRKYSMEHVKLWELK